MININQNTNNQTAMQNTLKKASWADFFENLKTMFLNYFKKLYLNKRVFLPVSIAFGTIILVIILGLIFGKKGSNMIAKQTPIPTSTSQVAPQASGSDNVLTNSKNSLNKLKLQINSLDVKKSHLQPPEWNFDVRFETP
jgi:hypothetical protein